MKNLKFFSLILLIFFVASCSKDLVDAPDQTSDDAAWLKSSSPKVKIALLSDVHYMHPSLLPADLEDSPTLLAALNRDRKIPQLSDLIFRKVLSELISEKPDIVLVCGDLAREGEFINHQTVSGLLQKLENNGMKVYVVPGNNDLLNPDAYSFTSEPPVHVPNITPDQFTSLFANFGYNEALYRDVNSLSYICQPCDGLWILGIDISKRTLQPNTLLWIQGKMAEANENGIRVIPFMHYGIIEHYTGQNKLEPLVRNAGENVVAFMNAGIRLLFTGHYHANDMVDFTSEGKTLTDIQTGSLVTPPYPYRIMTLDDNFINIDTRRVTSVDGECPEGADFLNYSATCIDSYLVGFFTYYASALQKVYGIPADKYPAAVPYFAKAFKAYIAGDEKLDPSERKKIDLLGQNVPTALPFLNSLWTDLPPKDNKVHIKLK
jgi:hypothetical protein